MRKNSLSKREKVMLTSLEEVMSGRGRYIAEFSEAFKDFKLNGFTFSYFVKGNTFIKGFFLSRMFSYFVNPRYNVACFLLKTDKKFGKKHLLRRIRTINKYAKKTNSRYVWFLLFSSHVNDSLRETIKTLDAYNLAVICIDTETGEKIHTVSFLGRQGKSLIRVKKEKKNE